MQPLLWGKLELTHDQRRTLTENAVALCIDRNAVLEIMSRCIIVRNYRELWLLDPEHPQGRRII